MKKELTPKNFIKRLLIISAALLLLCAVAVIIFDPFYHYHKPLKGLKAVLNEKEYQVPGTLKHFDYDAVIAGSSVSENNNNKWFDEAFNCKSIKAIRSYGATADLCYYLDMAFKSRDIKYVFLNLDPSSLTADADNTTFKEAGAPIYLYDENPFNDVQYLLNKDVLFERIPYMLASSFMGNYDEGESYNWAKWKSFDRDTILYHYIQSPVMEEMKPDDTYLDICGENVALIEAMVTSHPETKFYIYTPPYSILWWDNLYRDGDTAAYLAMEKSAFNKLLKYENVKLYNFQGVANIIYNLDNYTDSLHFSPEINRYMCDCLKDGTYLIKDASDIEASFEQISKIAFAAAEYTDENYKEKIKVDIY